MWSRAMRMAATPSVRSRRARTSSSSQSLSTFQLNPPTKTVEATLCASASAETAEEEGLVASREGEETAGISSVGRVVAVSESMGAGEVEGAEVAISGVWTTASSVLATVSEGVAAGVSETGSVVEVVGELAKGKEVRKRRVLHDVWVSVVRGWSCAAVPLPL